MNDQLNWQLIDTLLSKHVRKITVEELRGQLNGLMDRRVTKGDLPSWNDKTDQGDLKRIRSLVLAQQQIYLHRQTLLYHGTLRAYTDQNPYVMALAVRAFFETTAALGFMRLKLRSLSKGEIKSNDLLEDLKALSMGTKDRTISQAIAPKNVMNLLDQTDKLLKEDWPENSPEKVYKLRDSYEFLCEFAHPNFHSNQMACEIDPENNCYNFLHDKEVRSENYIEMLVELVLVTTLYITLHDSFERVFQKV